MTEVFSDEYFMKEALKEAGKAYSENEIPVGAVIVCKNKVIARAYNQTEKLTDVTAHAEMLAITSASNYLGAKFLSECDLYVTLEPCVMCAGAIHWARLRRIIIGAGDPKKGYSLLGNQILHPKTEVKSGVMATECQELLNNFFNKLRN
jgi:tRNA(adenine34) deaminase